eukprot:COSAG06_NODE_23346_length_695_cov_0.422819_1_plen_86_part_10
MHFTWGDTAVITGCVDRRSGTQLFSSHAYGAGGGGAQPQQPSHLLRGEPLCHQGRAQAVLRHGGRAVSDDCARWRSCARIAHARLL